MIQLAVYYQTCKKNHGLSIMSMDINESDYIIISISGNNSRFWIFSTRIKESIYVIISEGFNKSECT